MNVLRVLVAMTIAVGALAGCVRRTALVTEDPRAAERDLSDITAAPKPQCFPGAPLSDEPPEIQAVKASVRKKYMVAQCPTIGCADAGTEKATSNEQKNRVATPRQEEFNTEVSLDTLLESSDDDRGKWDSSKAAVVTGYVRHVFATGAESVNCRTSDKSRTDTHIEVVASDANPDAQDAFIVEVNPRMRALMANSGDDWTSQGLKDELEGRWVRFEGWLFFDDDHCNESLNTVNVTQGQCGGFHAAPWRKTAWELHPISSFEVLSSRP